MLQYHNQRWAGLVQKGLEFFRWTWDSDSEFKFFFGLGPGLQVHSQQEISSQVHWKQNGNFHGIVRKSIENLLAVSQITRDVQDGELAILGARS